MEELVEYLKKISAVSEVLGYEIEDDGRWWIKLALNINDQRVWETIQLFGHVFNYLSPVERLPTAFIPVSPPPYCNGGPQEYLSWAIECGRAEFKPEECVFYLEENISKLTRQ